MWEIFSGSIAAILVYRYGIRANQGLSMLGLFLILVAIFAYDRSTPFPSVYTVIPVVGALFVILYANENTFVGNLLSKKIFVSIGLISYSAYLLHQPIFAFTHIILARPEPTLMVMLAFFIFPLAYLLWKFIERPFRHTQRLNLSQVLFWTVSCIVFVVALSLTLKYVNLKTFGSVPMSKDYIADKKNERFKYVGLICAQKGWDICNEPQKGAINILSIGDSHEVDGYNSLYLALENSLDKISFSSSNLGGCPPYRNIREIVPSTHPDLNKCVALNAKRFDAAYLNSYDVIAVSVMYGWYKESYMMEYLDYLKRNFRGRVIIFGGTFGFSKPLPDIYGKSAFINSTDMESFIIVDPRINEKMLRDYADKNNFLFISKIDAFCPRSRCQFKFENDLLTYDQNHLSLGAVHYFADQNKEKIHNFVFNVKRN